jgi:hypothetical protein
MQTRAYDLPCGLSSMTRRSRAQITGSRSVTRMRCPLRSRPHATLLIRTDEVVE